MGKGGWGQAMRELLKFSQGLRKSQDGFPWSQSVNNHLSINIQLFTIYYLATLSWVCVLWEGVCGINESCKCLWAREEDLLAKFHWRAELSSQLIHKNHSKDPWEIYYWQLLHLGQAISWNSIYTLLHEYGCSSEYLVFILAMRGRCVPL